MSWDDGPEALIALEDGAVYRGRSFGAPGERCGEIVFNTSMTGYQEVVTDPSYAGQIVAMTYPLIGNCGVNPDDPESRGVQVEGFVVKECCRVPSNWRSRQSLPDYLTARGVIGIEGVDTRALTRHIRVIGAMKAAISTLGRTADELIAMARGWEGLVGRDMVQYVTCKESYRWDSASSKIADCRLPIADCQSEIRNPKSEIRKPRYRVVAYDFGVKLNILRQVAQAGCEVIVVPETTPAEEALALDPDGILLSNGPGDPAGLPHVVREVQKLIGRVPIFGICLGQQILGLALGGKTFKLRFGHRGANHPVKELASGRVDITTQNHGFCVDIDSLPHNEVEITHINLNDQTLEGMRHKTLPIFSVQYHPEASPGPHDAGHLFERFTQLMERGKR